MDSRDYLRHIDVIPLLSAEEEKTLAHRIINGDLEAREHMIRANMRLVIGIAHKWRGRGLEFDDLVAEGIFGLVRAVEKFDPNRNTRFSTYASYWVKQSIRNGLMKCGRTVRIPAYMYTLIGRWRKAEAELKLKSRIVTDIQIAKEAGIPRKKINAVLSALHLIGGVNESEDQHTFLDTVESRDQPDAATNEELQELVGELDRLPQREREIIKRRFGIDCKEETLKEISNDINITRERVRQIEEKGLLILQKRIEQKRERKQGLHMSKPRPQS